jgi:hypothetical protein
MISLIGDANGWQNRNGRIYHYYIYVILSTNQTRIKLDGKDANLSVMVIGGN